MLYIEREIAEQPDVIARLLDEEYKSVQQIAAAIRKFDPAFVSIAARGTSDNAARYAQYLLGAKAHLPVALATPSLHTLYAAPPNLKRALVIGVSQSGRAEDVRQVIADACKQGALTLAITNDDESPMAGEAEFHLSIHAGEEISVAATKTYTAQLAALAMLGTALVDDEEMFQALRYLPHWIGETLEHAETIADRVERYRYMERFIVLGRGYNYSTAFEISLKIKELCYITGEEYSEADFRHGPIALLNPGFPVIVVTPAGKALPLMLDLLEKLCERQAEPIVISNDVTALNMAQTPMMIPEDIPEWLSSLVAVIPGQLFAMNLALVRGHEVDQPRGLNKVTVTK
ncbi:MAG: SIS domain-containing protein [Chloroflexi bacterium]|nr:MAG: glucosamine--fructose-6-phosphate aminotransferase [Phototrophicales bacterium]RMF79678.1 MAG: SIS domain-containing protein [Chloroflexota bacterium]